MSIGDRPAYPTPYDDADGMTYRMWLIGQVAAGFTGGDLLHKDDDESVYTNDDCAGDVIRIADVIIVRLDAEERNRVEAQIELSKDRRTEPTR